MNSPAHLLVYAIMAITAVVSFIGFRNRAVFERWKFEVDGILVHKEYYRLVTGSFLHADLFHLLFNMVALYSFGPVVAMLFGPLSFVGLYFVCMILADLLALYIHRHHGDYSAVGASGAISGIIFAFTVFFPQADIGIILLPVRIPAWLFGLLFILGSMYGIKSPRGGNIGHEAHLGGAISGILLALALEPSLLYTNTLVVLALLVPFIIFMVLIVRWPEFLLIDLFFRNRNRAAQKRKSTRQSTEQSDELNSLLDKMAEKGWEGLSAREQKRLRDLSSNGS